MTLGGYFQRFFLIAVLAALPFSFLQAKEYDLPPGNDALIGNISYVNGSGLLSEIGENFNVGMNALLEANPCLPDDTQYAFGYVKVPTEYILPPLPRRGIIINLPEMRMYYYPPGATTVMTFPIGIGRIGKTIPIAYTSITKKVVNPTWIPPEDIRAFNKEKGIDLPHAMGPGPDNPLGPYAIYLRIPTYLIHSTISPESIGTRASFGCIRMHESDIKEFFPLVTPGTSVAIVDLPNKVGWYGDSLFLETHPPLEERRNDPAANINTLVHEIENFTKNQELTLVNWQLVSYLSDQRDGVPHEIGKKIDF